MDTASTDDRLWSRCWFLILSIPQIFPTSLGRHSLRFLCFYQFFWFLIQPGLFPFYSRVVLIRCSFGVDFRSYSPYERDPKFPKALFCCYATPSHLNPHTRRKKTTPYTILPPAFSVVDNQFSPIPTGTCNPLAVGYSCPS